jgi:hypothetical protein
MGKTFAANNKLPGIAGKPCEIIAYRPLLNTAPRLTETAYFKHMASRVGKSVDMGAFSLDALMLEGNKVKAMSAENAIFPDNFKEPAQRTAFRAKAIASWVLAVSQFQGMDHHGPKQAFCLWMPKRPGPFFVLS